MTGAELTAFRERLAWSRQTLSDELGISRNALRAYETGTSPIPASIALACAALAYGLKPMGAKY